ncbi:MAG: carbohydrate ABC transporter permease, partial [bacterium]|nr:carbohydrate ABC transporter permease [bacterium]
MAVRTLLHPDGQRAYPAPMKSKAIWWIGRLTTYFILAAWSFFIIFALSWVCLGSLKSVREVFRKPFDLPAASQWKNYDKAWNVVRMGRYALNSTLVVGVSLTLLLAVSTPAAYVLSRVEFRGRNLLTSIFIAGMGIPLPLLFIPLLVIASALRVVNTIPGLILMYVSVSIPFTVYLLTGFFVTLPQELEEAAIIDGCSHVQVFR